MISLHQGKSARDVSAASLADYIIKHKEAIDFVNHVFATKKRGITRSAMMAVVARAWYTEDRTRLIQFGKSMVFGFIKDEAGDSAAVKLREYAIQNSGRMNLQADIDYYRRSELALKYYCDKRELTRLVPAAAEMYPIPGETDE
jgi:hypothetical protein